jgi:hypothetical protein
MIVQIREVIPVKGIITQSLDASVIFSPFAAERLPGFPSLFRGVVRVSRAEYLSEVLCQFSFISMTDPDEHITLEVRHTLLEMGSRKDFGQRIFKIPYAISDKQTNTLDTSLLQCYKHLPPAGGTFTGTVEYAKNLSALVFLYAHDNVESLTLNTTLAVYLNMNGINKNNRIIGLQAPREPLLNISSQILNHTTDARLAVLLAIYFSKYFSYLRLCKSLTVQAACQQLTLFFLIAKKCQDGRMKVAVPVARYPELEYSTLAVTAATAKTVTLVPFTVAKKLTAFGRKHPVCRIFY